MTDGPILCWLDLETTGLDPAKGLILEVAAVLTDLELNEIDSYESVCRQPRETCLEMCVDAVHEMHWASGLFPAVFGAPRTLELVLGQLKTMITRVPPRRRAHLAGSSIDFDRRWLAHHASYELMGVFHHRVLDVSGYKLAFPDVFETLENPAHRAMADVRWNIEQHRKMRDIVGRREAAANG